jgi:hypothetical protein
MLHMQYCLVAAVIHTQFLHSQICIYICTHTFVPYSSQYRDSGQAKEIKKIQTAVNAACHRFASPGLGYGLDDTGSDPGWGRSCVYGKCPDCLWGLASLIFIGYQVLFWWH